MRTCLTAAALLALASPAVPAFAAEPSGVVMASDLQSIDRAVLEAAELALPPTGGAVFSPRTAPQGDPRTMLPPSAQPPVAHAMGTRPAAAPAEPKAGLFSKLKTAWPFNKKQTSAPAVDPFAAAQQSARERVVQQAGGAAPVNDGAVTPAAYQRSGGMVTTRQQAGPPKGVLSGLFGGSGSSASPSPAAAQPTPFKTAQSAPKESTRTSSKLRPGSRPAPQPKAAPRAVASRPTPRPIAVPNQLAVTRQAMTPRVPTPLPESPAPAAAPSEPAGGFLMVTDTRGAAAKPAAPKPIPSMPSGAPVFASDDAPQTAAQATGPMPIVVTNTKFAPKTESLDPVVVSSTPPNPSPSTAPLAAVEADPTAIEPETVTPPAAEPYQSTQSEVRIASKRPRPTLPSRPSTDEPSQRARDLLAEAHGIAATAKSYEEFSGVIQRCRYVLAIDQSQEAQAYAKQLAGWALSKRGETLDEVGRLDEAETDYLEALACDAECWRAEHALGIVAARRGDATEALRRFNRTIDMNPEYAKAFSNRAALSVQAGDFETALDDYAQAIAIDPDLGVAHAGRGRVCHLLGMLDEGLQHLDAAELLDPQDAMVAVGRGDVLTDLGRYGQAIAAYRRAIATDSDSAPAHRNLAWALATCPIEQYRDSESALRHAQRAEELATEVDDLTLDTKAAALAAAGRFDEASDTQLRAIEIAPSDEAASYRDRLAMYQRGEAFTSQPTGVRQATYLK